ncbi:MAG: TIGR04141 family sporadically distributed protein [Bryobacteraceae bacterium]
MTDRRFPFTAYLLKANKVADCEKALFQGSIPLSAPLNGNFQPIPTKGGTPPWVGAVQTLLESPITASMTGGSPAGLLLLKRVEGTFVITFGHAWQQLDDDWLERSFGLRTALNAIPKERVIEIKTEQVFARWHLASERAPRATTLKEFGVDFDRDLVAVVEGQPTNPKLLGEIIRGGTSLRVHLPIKGLPEALDHALTLHKSIAYQKDWPDIDSIIAVSDEPTKTTLDDLLDQEITTPQAAKRIVLYTPAHRKDEAITADSYVYGRLTDSAARTSYLTYDNWIAYLKRSDKTPSVAEARATALHLLDETNNELKRYAVYDSFGYELGHNGQPYILSSGTWYEVAQNFIKRTDERLKTLEPPSIGLPAWGGRDEGVYNEACGKLPGMLDLDAKNVFYGGGHSQLECCDLLHLKSKTLYFVKIGSKSSGMSHLVEQVRRTAELLFAPDRSYREELAKGLEKHYPKVTRTWLESRPLHHEWTLCMVSLGRPALKLPFFARCAVAKLSTELIHRGHRVAFIHT